MKFGVVVCRNCKNAVGVNLTVKSTKCRRCNKSLNLKKCRVLYETSSEQDLAEAVGQFNVKLQKGTEEYQDLLRSINPDADNELSEKGELFKYDQSRSRDPHQRIAARLKKLENFQTRLLELATELCKEFNEFTTRDFTKVLEYMGSNPDDSEKYIAQLIANGIIYEPHIGSFKVLNDN